MLLSRDLLLLYREIGARVARMPAVKAATRIELLRRVECAREYLHGCVDRSVSLEEAARAACLSRFHFHRAFTQAHGRTPHDYLTDLRLGRARTLLAGGMTVNEVAVAVGFSGAPAFTRRFRARFGSRPGGLRYLYDGRSG